MPGAPLVPLLLILLAMAQPMAAQTVAAQTLRDGPTGLTIDPPAGYEAIRLDPRGANTVVFGIRKPTDRDTGCQVGFAPAPQNRRYSQNELNEVAQGELWQGMARQAISGLFQVDGLERFEHEGIVGAMLEGRPRPLDAMPEAVRQRSEQLRMMFVILETPLGRTSTVCVGEAADYAARRAEFMEVARASSPPR
jgi:hypothetical protein